MNIQSILEKNNLIIFAGAGLSKSLNLPDWNKMVIEIIEKSNNNKLTPFIDLLKDNTMSALDVLDFLKNDIKEIHDYIRNNFKISQTSNTDLQKKLLKLSNNKVITTNYDNAFEIASDNVLIASKPTSKYNINEIQKSNEGFIFKLHGSFEEPDNCIIFKDDYHKLYYSENNEAAPEKLKQLFASYTFLFVGFGFNDPDINLIFDKIDKIFGGYNKHFIITSESSKFNEYNFLEPIEIENYSLLESKIDELLAFKETINQSNLNNFLTDLPKVIDKKKIAILYPDVIDKNFSEDYKSTITLFEELNADLYIGHLNIHTLQQIDDYDLLIILSTVYKKKLYIEENNLKSNLLDINDICDNIPNANIPILLLSSENINISNLEFAITNIFNYKNQTIKRFLHKIVKEKNFTFNENCVQSNSIKWFINLEKGKAIRKNFYGNDRDLSIGKKCLTEVIGRIEEQSSLASRLLTIHTSNKILNIKASGGLGKTTLTKKIAYEFYNRGYYKQGVNFKSCENVKKFEDLEDLIIEGFNLSEIINFKEYLIENFSNNKIDLLLILDNFETIINNLSVDDYRKSLDLLEFVSDYSNIIITSREKISTKDFEDVFNLTPMTTDDALELFKLNYKGKKSYKIEEIKILRSEILEELLANNPLAIKLVTTSRPEMQINQLRDQIRNHFFESINEEYSDVFKNNADLNIERSKSIFQSINYSYSFLNQRQKLAFELLSLFPDGITLNDFKKCFQKRKSSNNITDTEIKQLENKSLLDNYNGRLQLQPIIRRFSDYQFNKHKENMQKYCIDAYRYNCYILTALRNIQKNESFSLALRIFSSLKNNLLMVLEYIPYIKIEETGLVRNKTYFLNYIYDIEDYLKNAKNIKYFEDKTKSLISFFEDIPDSKNLIDVIIHKANYYQSEFDYSYKEMCKLLSVNEMKERNFQSENELERKWKDIISYIHSMEGYTISYLKSLILNKYYNRALSSDYYYLGIDYLGINHLNFIKKHSPFYYFEYLLQHNDLIVEKLKKYISNLYMEEHLEIMQCTYTLSKKESISKQAIQKLVVTNPYTRGLKNLMFAFNTIEKEEKIQYFEKAINNLKHIRYYHLEALYYFSRYLKEIKSEGYEEFIFKGIADSKKYKYQYLDYLFSNLLSNTNEKYEFNYEYYGTDGIQEFITTNMEQWSKIK